MSSRALHRTLPFRLALVAAFVATAARAEIEITLKNDFIEKFKNAATITTQFTVDKAHKRPNSPSKDGDLHAAGRAPEVGLPIVAEIMNAKQFQPAVAKVHSVEGTNEPISLIGAWRLWCEHGGSSEQIQGAPLEPFTTSNPDHVFEIHPATKVAGMDVLTGFIPIEGYRNKDAAQAFHAYENLSSQITLGTNTTTITTRMGGFNYVEFQIQLNQDPFPIKDGVLVMAEVQDLEGELLVRNRRMVFVKDTPPAREVLKLRKGGTLHVLGMPRINLALVSWRMRNAKKKPEVLGWQLPYEMIIVGVFGPGKPAEESEARAEGEDAFLTAEMAGDVLWGGAPFSP
jgi:hypothetical protein